MKVLVVPTAAVLVRRAVTTSVSVQAAQQQFFRLSVLLYLRHQSGQIFMDSCVFSSVANIPRSRLLPDVTVSERL